MIELSGGPRSDRVEKASLHFNANRTNFQSTRIFRRKLCQFPSQSTMKYLNFDFQLNLAKIERRLQKNLSQNLIHQNLSSSATTQAQLSDAERQRDKNKHSSRLIYYLNWRHTKNDIKAFVFFPQRNSHRSQLNWKQNPCWTETVSESQKKVARKHFTMKIWWLMTLNLVISMLWGSRSIAWDAGGNREWRQKKIEF